MLYSTCVPFCKESSSGFLRVGGPHTSAAILAEGDDRPTGQNTMLQPTEVTCPRRALSDSRPMGPLPFGRASLELRFHQGATMIPLHGHCVSDSQTFFWVPRECHRALSLPRGDGTLRTEVRLARRAELDRSAETLLALVAAIALAFGVSTSASAQSATRCAPPVWQYPKPHGHELMRIVQGSGHMVAVGAFGATSYAPSVSSWKAGSTPVTSALQSLTWTGTEFVGVGAAGTVLASESGESWIELAPPAYSGDYFDAIWAEEKLVVVGGIIFDPMILVSDDLIAWSQVVPAGADVLYGVAWKDGTFVAVGFQGTILSSPDGLAWTVERTGTGPSLFTVASGPDGFVAAGFDGLVAFSADGSNWMTSTIPSNSIAQQVIWDGSQWLALLSGSTGFYEIWQSTDGVDWSLAETLPYLARDYRSLLRFNDDLVVVGESGIVVSKAAGSPWVLRSGSHLNGFKDLLLDNDTWYGVGGADAARATQLFRWSLVLQPTNANSIASSGNVMLAAGPFGQVRRSTDGVNWTLQTTGTNEHLSAVTFGPGGWVVVGQNGTILRSPGGFSWQTVHSDPDLVLLDVIATDDAYHAVGGRLDGTAQVLLRSPDGVVWTPEQLDEGGYLRAITASNSHIVAVGGRITELKGVVWSSQDGLEWGSETLDEDLNEVAWSGEAFVLVAGARALYTGAPSNWQREDIPVQNLRAALAVGPYRVFAGDDGILDQICGCPGASEDQLVLTADTVVGEESHTACDEIVVHADYEIAGSLSLRAGRRVTFGDGFRVLSGGTLEVVVGPWFD